MKLVGPLAARSPGLRLALALEIERHCSADEILQGRLIDLVPFVDVDGAPALVLATDGNFYGTTSQGGANNDGTVFRITSSGKVMTLHSFNGTDGARPTA